ncbi:hypothetical protein V5279_34680 [Bradyrhizobium sp. 26S5]|uniref:hypothetical protein n=1 Tax=Bradyrhizobium sp. 26S5 TaxID=3139729 RepID=UPI0030D2FE1D
MSSPRAAPTVLDVYTQGAPWTNATPNRILKTTAVPVSLPYIGMTAWDANTARFSAVSAPDPTTGIQYFCLVLDDGGTPTGMRYDFSLNPVAIPDHPDTAAGVFMTLTDGCQLSTFYGWTYIIDPASGGHYFVCAASGTTPSPTNGLYWICLTETYKLLPPSMQPYQPASGIEPQGVWSTGDTVWFTKQDGSLWQVLLADVLANKTTSLQQVSSTGTVQGVISDGAAAPTYYVLSAVATSGGYSLVQFQAGNPASAVTIEAGFNPGGIKTTPDGAVWKVISDLNPGDLQQPKSEVRLLVPSYPVRGQLPAWVDPFLTADPSLYAAGLTQSIMDAIPLSATNILLLTTPNASSYSLNPTDPTMLWQMTRVGIGVFDQPAIPLNVYTGTALTAYSQISQDLINAGPSANDIRAQYSQMSSAQAADYIAALSTMTVPPAFTEPAVWNGVQTDLYNELSNLVSTSSFWTAITQLVWVQSQVESLAAGSVSGNLAIKTTATLINSTSRQVNALNIASLTTGGTASVLTFIGGILAVSAPAGAATLGLATAAAAIVGLICAFFGSRNTDYSISVSDPMYYISAKLGEIDNALGKVFTATQDTMTAYAVANTKDGGMLATVGALYRSGLWTASPPDFTKGSTLVPSDFEAYYNACVLTYLQAFVPLITGMNLIIIGDGEKWSTYKGQPVYVSPAHTWWNTMGDNYQGALLQYASKDNQSKPLGQDLDALLFTTLGVSYEEVFQQWNIPTTPSWTSSE